MTIHIDPQQDLAQQLGQIVDPLLHEAEVEAEQRQPQRMELPPVPFPHSKPVREVATEYDKLHDAWVEANTALVSVLDDYRRAVGEERVAIAKAAREGAAKHPGHAKSEKLRESLEWAMAVCTAKRTEVDRYLHHSPHLSALETTLDYYLTELFRMADDTETMLTALLSEFQQRWAETRSLAIRTTYSLDFLADIVRKKYGVTLGNTITDPIPELHLPALASLKLGRVRNAEHVLADRITHP